MRPAGLGLSTTDLGVMAQIKSLSFWLFADQKAFVERLDVSRLLPDTDEYMTYSGSLTQPSCNEGVRWIVINKALQISRLQISQLRKLMQGDVFNPKASLSNNFRPLQPLNSRIIHTNIDFHRQDEVSTTAEQPLRWFRENKRIAMMGNIAHETESLREGVRCSNVALLRSIEFPGGEMSFDEEQYALQEFCASPERDQLTIN